MNRADKANALSVVDVEEVFTFLSERARAPSTSAQLRSYVEQVWDALMSEIGNVFSKFPPTPGTRKTYRTLIENHIRSRDSVVSFNYDTVFESSLPKGFDWAYQGIQDTTKCLRVIKPHGSINWELGSEITISEKASRSVIVAPTHLKFVATSGKTDDTRLRGYLDQSRQIQEIWAEMEAQMRDAKALIFIGYSFPVADLYFSSILRSVLADRDGAPGIVLVNPDSVALGERLKQRFALTEIVRYFDFAQFIQINRRDLLAQL